MSKRNVWVALCAAAAMSVGMAAGVSAARDGQNTNSSTTTRQDNMNGNGGRGTTMLSSGDRKFMMTAAQGGMAEIEMARVALERASSEEVKTYAQRMIDDHTKSGEELMGIAQAKGVALPSAPDAKHMAMMTKMRALSGVAFDREYMMMAGRKDHEKMEKLFRDESMKGRDADVRAFAAKTLPVVREHLSMARMMHDRMMGTKNMNSNSGGMNSNN
jgi:putative membrane protein